MLMTIMLTFMLSFIECDKDMKEIFGWKCGTIYIKSISPPLFPQFVQPVPMLVILNILNSLMICHTLIDSFELRCATVIFREDCFAWEGGCIFCPRRHQEAATNLPLTKIFHIFTFKRGVWVSFISY